MAGKNWLVKLLSWSSQDCTCTQTIKYTKVKLEDSGHGASNLWVISILEKLKQEDCCAFVAILGYLVVPACLTKGMHPCRKRQRMKRKMRQILSGSFISCMWIVRSHCLLLRVMVTVLMLWRPWPKHLLEKKAFIWGLASSFRGWVHRHGRNQTGSSRARAVVWGIGRLRLGLAWAVYISKPTPSVTSPHTP